MNQKAINFCPEEKEDKGAIVALTAKTEHGIIRSHNVGNSNYAEMPVGYQPWDI